MTLSIASSLHPTQSALPKGAKLPGFEEKSYSSLCTASPCCPHIRISFGRVLMTSRILGIRVKSLGSIGRRTMFIDGSSERISTSLLHKLYFESRDRE